MKISPLDIQQQQFHKKLIGFDPREVEVFLELLKNEFEEIIKENNDLKDELRKMVAELEDFKEKEQTLKEAMLTAQRILEEIKTNARKEAELIVAESQVKAQELVNSAQLRSMEIMDEIKELKRQKIQFEANLRALLETHLKMIETEKEREEELTAIEEKLRFFAKK